MPSLFRANMASLVVALGTNISRSVDMSTEAYDAEAFIVQSPASIDGKTYTWEVSVDGTTFATLKDTAGASVQVPAVSCAITYNGVITACKLFRLKASGNVTADVTFLIAKSTRA